MRGLLKKEFRELAPTAMGSVAMVVFFCLLASTFVVRAEYGNSGQIPTGFSQIHYELLKVFRVIFLLVVAGFGFGQLHTDRTKKASAFLVTLATTPGRLLVAKVNTGVAGY